MIHLTHFAWCGNTWIRGISEEFTSLKEAKKNVANRYGPNATVNIQRVPVYQNCYFAFAKSKTVFYCPACSYKFEANKEPLKCPVCGEEGVCIDGTDN